MTAGVARADSDLPPAVHTDPPHDLRTEPVAKTLGIE